MFTGIVETVGEVARTRTLAGGLIRCRVRAPAVASRLAVGDSVAVDGACVTNVGARSRSSFAFDLIPHTQTRTIAGRYRPGSRVNLELPLATNGRFHGHLVQGHVDGVGKTLALETREMGTELRVEVPKAVHALSVSQGSITVNGVSLTVAELGARRDLVFGITPYTLEHTNLGELEPGDPVNLESDILAKYVARLQEAQ